MKNIDFKDICAEKILRNKSLLSAALLVRKDNSSFRLNFDLLLVKERNVLLCQSFGKTIINFYSKEDIVAFEDTGVLNELCKL